MSRGWEVIFSAPFSWAPGLSWVVIYWMSVAIAGLGFKFTNARASVRRMRRVTADDPGAFRIVAIVDLVSQGILGTCLLLALLAGILAGLATTAQPPRDPTRAAATTLVLELVVTAIGSHAFLVWLGRSLAESRLHRQPTLEERLPAVVVADPETLAIVGWTAEATALFGWSPAEAIGKDVAGFLIPPSWQADHRAGVERWRAAGSPAVHQRELWVTVRAAAGHEVPVVMVLRSEAVGDRTLFVAYFRSRPTVPSPTGDAP